MDNYEYMNKSSINEDLICEICKNPFIDPVILPSPCEQTFCLKCIQSNLENHSNNCLKCNKKSLTNTDLKNESPILRNMLDKLLVKCCSCSEENIQRSNFSEHIKQKCPKRIVHCSANDIQCPWTGHFDELNQHVNNCPYEELRHFLTKLINDVRRIDELNQLQINFQTLENKFQQQQNQIQQIENENEILNKQINEMEKFENENQILNKQINKMKNFEIELKDLNDFLQLTNILIENFENKIKFLQENLDEFNLIQIKNETLNELYQQEQIQNDSLNKQNQSLQEQLLQDKQEFEQLKQYCEQIQVDNQQLNQQCLLNNEENNHLNEQNQYLQEQVLQYKQEFEQLNQHCEQIQADNQQLIEQCSQYNIKIDQLTINIKRLETKLYQPIIQSHSKPTIA
ncbi:unnamed protein product [Rotaria sordida]|uniref:Uncharacterized protein n=1 Tax=Rotaria sordida TaxID=392033 RepID=A0A819VXP4_9BILA|nr:unnamed protein product [Rotaria sordida]